MKSQDIVILLKLISLERSQKAHASFVDATLRLPNDWRGWGDDLHGWLDEVAPTSQQMLGDETSEPVFSLRSLEISTGISKSEVGASLRRCYETGLAIQDRLSGRPRANTKGLLDFIVFGLKYVFPAHLGTLERGIPTASGAPVLAAQLLSGGDQIYVWKDVRGSSQGTSVEPLYKSVPHAVRKDPFLYAMLALTDSIRLGRERESSLARQMLAKCFGRES